jgi:hypothetical protein
VVILGSEAAGVGRRRFLMNPPHQHHRPIAPFERRNGDDAISLIQKIDRTQHFQSIINDIEFQPLPNITVALSQLHEFSCGHDDVQEHPQHREG